jgi:hypothetical protein
MQQRRDQGCKIFLGTKYQNRENIANDHEKYQIAIKYFNVRKIDQMVIKYTKIFHCKTLQNLPKLEFFVSKQTIWQSWKGLSAAKINFRIHLVFFTADWLLVTH